MEGKITVDIPIKLIQEALDCGILQNTGSLASSESRSREVERREHHFAELVISIILKEFNNQKRLK